MILPVFYDVDITQPLLPVPLQPMLVTKDALANRIGVRLFEGKTPYSPGGSCAGFAVRRDGATVALTGAISGNEMYIDLPAAAYAVEGPINIGIKNVNGSAETTVFLGMGTVLRGETGTVIDPGTIIPSVAALISDISDAVASIPADYTTLLGSIAHTFSSSESYTAGKYVWYNGELYRFNVAHPAGAWIGTDAARYTATDELPLIQQALGTKADAADVAELKSAITYLNDNIANYDTISSVSFASGGISGTGQIQGDSKRIRVKMASMPIMHSGDIIEIGGVFEGRIFANTTQGYTDYNIITGNTWVKGQFVIPENADGKYIGILLRVIGHENEDVTSYVDTVNDYVKYYRVETVKQIANEAVRFTVQHLSEEEQTIARTNINAASNDGMIYEEKVVGYTRTNSKFWDISSGTRAVLTDIASNPWGAYSAIAVTPGEEYRIKSCQGKSHKARIWTIVDDDYNIIAMAPDNFDNGYDAIEETFIVPENGTKLVSTIYSAGGISAMLLYKKVNRLVQLAEPLSGKKMSLLGDSISAYAGTIPSGNEAYYTGSNSGVSSPDQMWWKILCDRTGMVPLVINGWSGSGVNWQTDSAHINKVPMSDDSRCNGLHDGTTMPDVIIIAGGVNDYTYAQSGQNEPLVWDGKTVPGYTEPTEGKKVYNSFTEAYVAMIKKLQTNYPNAIVVALSTWFTMRGTDNGYVLTHTVGQNVYSQQDYNDKIRFVAEQMHIPYIDVSNIGFNRNNFYPTYAQDSSTIPTHPNATGQSVMGKAIAEKLVGLVKGFIT